VTSTVYIDHAQATALASLLRDRKGCVALHQPGWTGTVIVSAGDQRWSVAPDNGVVRRLDDDTVSELLEASMLPSELRDPA